jgi:radical SAM protein
MINQPSNDTSGRPPRGRPDFDRDPFVVFWELTRACDLTCQHCRACAQPNRHRNELDTRQAAALIDDLARFDRKPVLIVTGGDPMKRPDVVDLVRYAAHRELTPAMAASVTPLLTPHALMRLQNAGLKRLALSLDGADAATHDGIRGVPGSFDRTIKLARAARSIGLPLQLNTTVMQRNVDQLEQIADLVGEADAVLWSVFFLVPVGRGQAAQRISADRYEEVFEFLWRESERRPFSIKTTEAHHWRRFVLQRRGDPQRGAGEAATHADRIQRAPLGVSDGKGCMFISHVGQVFPSGFLPKQAGRFPADSVVETYRNAPLFRQLRDADQLKGKCGVCEFRKVCGGSRARAYCLTGDALAAEPDCVYQPAAWGEPAGVG